MILNTETTTLEQNGSITNAEGFKMRSSRKAFKILSDLYSDKPLAIVRELGCNAHDSHVQAGKADVPFHIHAPNTLEPWITIQDFGTGISPENIYSIYAVYFESTKTETNDQIGCLGLGSKSPFCYTDNFTITSIYNGKKSLYNAYFNETTMPTIALMSTEDTTEGNGVTIQIPVKPMDFHNFYRAIAKSFRFFDVRPTISGGSIDWNEEKPLMAGDDWAIYKSFGYNEAFAVMGGVTYPLDVFKFSDELRKIVNRSGIVLKFNTGELDIVPSREGLSYDASTIKALEEKMTRVLEDIKKTVQNTLDSQPNILEAIKTYLNLSAKFDFFLQNFNGYAWKSNGINDPYKLIWDVLRNNNLHKGHKHLTRIYKATWGRSKFDISDAPAFTESVKWIVDDLERGGLSRSKQEVRNNSIDNFGIVLISKDAHKALLDFGFPPETFSLASALMPVSKAKAQAKAQAPAQTKFTIYTIGSYWKIQWDSKTMDIKNPIKFYIEKGEKYDFNLKVNGLTSINNKDSLQKLLKQLNISPYDVALVSKRKIKDIAPLSTNLEDYANANFKLDYDADEWATYHTHLSSTWANTIISDLVKNKNFSTIKDTPFKKFALRLSEISQIVEKKNLNGIYNLLTFKVLGTAEVLENADPMETFLFQKLMAGSMSPDNAISVLNLWQESK